MTIQSQDTAEDCTAGSGELGRERRRRSGAAGSSRISCPAGLRSTLKSRPAGCGAGSGGSGGAGAGPSAHRPAPPRAPGSPLRPGQWRGKAARGLCPDPGPPGPAASPRLAPPRLPQHRPKLFSWQVGPGVRVRPAPSERSESSREHLGAPGRPVSSGLAVPLGTRVSSLHRPPRRRTPERAPGGPIGPCGAHSRSPPRSFPGRHAARFGTGRTGMGGSPASLNVGDTGALPCLKLADSRMPDPSALKSALTSVGP